MVVDGFVWFLFWGGAIPSGLEAGLLETHSSSLESYFLGFAVSVAAPVKFS